MAVEACRKPKRLLIVDIDGVVWRDLKPLEANIDGLRMLRKEARMVFVTNNSSRSRRLYSQLLTKLLGFHVPVEDIVTSGSTAARLLSRLYGKTRTYVIGGPGLIEELVLAGHTVVTESEAYSCFVDAVVVGFTRSYSHVTLSAAVHALRSCEALFVATNADTTLPVSAGVEPGAGAIVSFLAKASGRDPIIVGKPNTLIVEELAVKPDETLVIGDKLETDMELARALGAEGLLVDEAATRVEKRGWFLVAPSIRDYALLSRCDTG